MVTAAYPAQVALAGQLLLTTVRGRPLLADTAVVLVGWSVASTQRLLDSAEWIGHHVSGEFRASLRQLPQQAGIWR